MDKGLSPSKSSVISGSREKNIVFLLCTLAAVHVFFYSAVFPFFNNVDEPIHFDLVIKYSHGHVPRKMEQISPDSAVFLALYSAYVYAGTTNMFPDHQFPPPPWTKPVDKMKHDLVYDSAGWRSQPNFQSSEPPLYYALAAVWWHLGKCLGLQDGWLLYWLRFLNIPVVIALVWMAWLAARTVFPDKPFIRLAVPVLMAFMPQSALYTIGCDVMPAVAFGITFICLYKWLSAENPSVSLGAVTGIAFAATYLAKMTDLPLLAVATVALVFMVAQSIKAGNGRKTWPALLAFVCFAAPPIIAWMIWCKLNYGDLTGSKLKVGYFGWTIKPLGQWWHHPLFSPQGFWFFVSGNISSIWQGEFTWHLKPMASPGSDFVYTALSLVLLAVAALGAFRDSRVTPPQRRALWFGLACFAASFAFFALLSIGYDFHACQYPSAASPYFVSGRYWLGLLIPFLLLVAYGIDRALVRLGNAAKFIALAVMILAMLAVEVATDWPAFSSPFNWFHLP
ncbi:MAG TPA: DUF2142 domain-containing protein [Candidatus Acidoferrales bacterium]|jgi:hypothetical protein|nr:DUF2142 domain-containing protein [Candidatus Acidoferrales bacterium]